MDTALQMCAVPFFYGKKQQLKGRSGGFFINMNFSE